MKKSVFILALFLLTSTQLFSQPAFRFHGLKMLVHDLDKAKAYYESILGFKVEANKLQTGSWPIYLEETSNPNHSKYPGEARTGLTLQTYKLLPQIDAMRSKGVVLKDSLLSRNGVGISIPFIDPSGNVLSLMEVQVRPISPFEGLTIYNTGVTISDMESAIAFYEGVLGFKEWSRNYLPDALPLKHGDGSFAFMIHYKKGLSDNRMKYPADAQMVIVIETQDLSLAATYFEEKDINFIRMNDRLVIRDPEGNNLEIRKAAL